MTTSEISTILTDAITRSVSHTEIVQCGVACDIGEALAEINSLLEADEQVDYTRDNDGRYDIWCYGEDDAEGSMRWRLSVLCGDSA